MRKAEKHDSEEKDRNNLIDFPAKFPSGDGGTEEMNEPGINEGDFIDDEEESGFPEEMREEESCASARDFLSAEEIQNVIQSCCERSEAGGDRAVKLDKIIETLEWELIDEAHEYDDRINHFAAGVSELLNFSVAGSVETLADIFAFRVYALKVALDAVKELKKENK